MKLLALFLLAFISGGILTAQTFDLELEYDGELREYLLHIPEAYDGSEALPLLFSLHGLTNTGQINRATTRFHEIADTANFIVCFPTALTNGFGLTAWTNGLIVGSGEDDTGFLRHLVNVIDEEYPVDRNRLYFTGFSMGGFMSNRMACEFSEEVAAIASHSGTISENIRVDCQPTRKMPMMHIHGNSDLVVAYDGNWAGGFVSVDSLMRHWREHNDCPNSYTITELPDTVNDDRTVDLYQFSGCDEGIELLLYEVHNHNHAWMQPENDISGSAEIWKFLSRHSLDGEIVSAIEEQESENFYRLFPNPVGDHFTLQLPSQEVLKQIEIIDIYGSSILVIKSQDLEIDVSSLQTGFYLLRINKHKVLPFIKQ